VLIWKSGEPLATSVPAYPRDTLLISMQKYLFVAANECSDWGGSELLWSSVAEKLARQGMEVRVSVKDFGKPIREVEQLRSAGCQIFYRRTPSFLYRLGRKFSPLPEYTRKHVRSAGDGVDLVVVSQGGNTDGLPWMEAARAAGYKYAVIAQCAAEAWWPDDDIAERLAASYESASRAYFVSQANLDLSRRQFATPLHNAKIIRNPFNVRYEARPAWPANQSDELCLACVGRLDAVAKGQDLLLEVLSLPHWRERNVRVSLAGKGVNGRVLRRRAEQLNLAGVEFMGYQSDIEQLWSRHHALVLPSRYEGMPLAIVEAMLCGRPCIVTDVAGHKELVRDGVNGFLAKAPTVELLDEAMSRAWENRGWLREMGCTAASDVRQWVSADPSEDFVRELTALVEG
jgi:glycosyltransferase involved in cell wall biosynthesis